MTFREFTLVDENQIEVMVDINTENGKIICLYCYADGIPKIENIETGHFYKIKTKSGKNHLFVHIQDKARIFSLLVTNGWICITNDEDEAHNEDIAIFEKCLSLYNLSHIQNIY